MGEALRRGGWVVMALAALGGAACLHKAAPVVVVPTMARDLSPAVAEPDLAAQVAGNTAFALDLAKRAPQGNLIFSPYSISAALAMAYAGARGDTATQMATTLHFVLPPEKLHLAFNALDLALAEHATFNFKLHVANALWLADGVKPEPAFVATVGANYGAGLRQIRFQSPERARTTINRWTAKQTEGCIPDLLGPGVLTSDTRLAITDAVYFFALWAQKFLWQDTQDGPFTRLDGQRVTVPLMHKAAYGHAYAEGHGWQAVELPYRGGQEAFDVLLPAAGQLAAFEQQLTAENLNGLLAQLRYADVDLALPRFRATGTLDLKAALADLGMADAFGNGADFSGISREVPGFAAVAQKAWIRVDENGTEAAAATDHHLYFATSGAVIRMTVDHPFLFLIRDLPTGQILFWGRIVDPSA